MSLTLPAPLENALNVFVSGPDIQQHEWELRVFFSKVLSELKPARTVELGTYKGCMAALLSLATSDKTVSVDIDHYGTAGAKPYAHNLDFVSGDARMIGCPEAVVKILGGPIDLLFIDDGHCYDDMVSEMKIWPPLVRPGGWVCFHDINPLANLGPHGEQQANVQTARFWKELAGAKEEIIANESHRAFRGVIPHGGIGILRV